MNSFNKELMKIATNAIEKGEIEKASNALDLIELNEINTSWEKDQIINLLMYTAFSNISGKGKINIDKAIEQLNKAEVIKPGEYLKDYFEIIDKNFQIKNIKKFTNYMVNKLTAASEWINYDEEFQLNFPWEGIDVLNYLPIVNSIVNYITFNHCEEIFVLSQLDAMKESELPVVKNYGIKHIKIIDPRNNKTFYDIDDDFRKKFDDIEIFLNDIGIAYQRKGKTLKSTIYFRVSIIDYIISHVIIPELSQSVFPSYNEFYNSSFDDEIEENDIVEKDEDEIIDEDYEDNQEDKTNEVYDDNPLSNDIPF